MSETRKKAAKLITFVTYKKNNVFSSFLNSKAVVLELPNEAINLLEKMGNINGVFFTGVPKNDRYLWSYLYQAGSVDSFAKEISIIGEPYFIFTPPEVMNLLNQEFLRNDMYVFEYGRNIKPVPSSFCELYDDGFKLSIKKIQEPVCSN